MQSAQRVHDAPIAETAHAAWTHAGAFLNSPSQNVLVAALPPRYSAQFASCAGSSRGIVQLRLLAAESWRRKGECATHLVHCLLASLGQRLIDLAHRHDAWKPDCRWRWLEARGRLACLALQAPGANLRVCSGWNCSERSNSMPVEGDGNWRGVLFAAVWGVGLPASAAQQHSRHTFCRWKPCEVRGRADLTAFKHIPNESVPASSMPGSFEGP